MEGGVGGVALIMCLPQLVRLKASAPGIILFKVFRPFSYIFFIDFVDFWDPFGLHFRPFPDLFTSCSATFWHLDFILFFQCLLHGFWHHF